MEKLIQKVKDNPRSRDFNVTITGFDSETEMEAYQSSLWMDQQSLYNNPFVFGIVFKGLSDTARSISYKIRMNNNYFYNTKDLMPINMFPGPDYSRNLKKECYDFYVSTLIVIVYEHCLCFILGGATQYMSSGFAGIQLLLDKILIEDLTGPIPPSEQVNY